MATCKQNNANVDSPSILTSSQSFAQTMAPLAQYLTLALCSIASLAAPLERRAVINHDAVVGFPETVPSGTLGSLYLKYKPFLKVEGGCVPFPAVDASGNTG
jgi:hypothetical protein